ncbi:MAG: hypothetical protein RIA63_05190, partial [Cyclobacteriaceae bacterium]
AFNYKGPNWLHGVTKNGTFKCFSDTTYYKIPLESSDRIHIWEEGYFAFRDSINNLLVYLRVNEEAPASDPITFIGYRPVRVSGDVRIFKYQEHWLFEACSNNGGLIYFSDISTDTIRFTSPIHDTNCVDIALYPNLPSTVTNVVESLIK